MLDSFGNIFKGKGSGSFKVFFPSITFPQHFSYQKSQVALTLPDNSDT